VRQRGAWWHTALGNHTITCRRRPPQHAPHIHAPPPPCLAAFPTAYCVLPAAYCVLPQVLGLVGSSRKRVLLLWQAVELSKFLGFPATRTLEVARWVSCSLPCCCCLLGTAACRALPAALLSGLRVLPLWHCAHQTMPFSALCNPVQCAS
jgi:hypothetical protein